MDNDIIYVYIETNPQLWEVGYYGHFKAMPGGYQEAEFIAESSHTSEKDAVTRVTDLNGGNPPPGEPWIGAATDE